MISTMIGQALSHYRDRRAELAGGVEQMTLAAGIPEDRKSPMIPTGIRSVRFWTSSRLIVFSL